MNDHIYIETTAVIDAVFKSFPEVVAILQDSREITSSQYSKMEIKKGFLNNLVLLYNKTVQAQKMSEVQQYISNLAQAPARYRLGAMLDAMTRFYKHIEDQRPEDFKTKHGNISKDVIIKRDLESFLRFWIKNLLRKIDRLVDDLLNPMECFVDLEAPRFEKGLFVNKPYECLQSAVECKIKDFFNKSIEDFNKILSELKNIPEADSDEETRRRVTSLKKVINKHLPYSTRKFSNHSQNADLCWACGDAIHAVVAPTGSKVVNRNEKHFKPICYATGKESLTYKSPIIK